MAIMRFSDFLIKTKTQKFSICNYLTFVNRKKRNVKLPTPRVCLWANPLSAEWGIKRQTRNYLIMR